MVMKLSIYAIVTDSICPGGFVQFQTSCYWFSSKMHLATWSEAKVSVNINSD